MAELIPYNKAVAALAAPMDASQTTLTLDSGIKFPTGALGEYRIVFSDSDEICLWTGARSGTTISGLTRGAEGTTATTHALDAMVACALTLAGLQALFDAKAAVGHGHSHASLSSVSANQHHNQAHSISGADHTGTLAHTSLGSVSADQHHTQDHDHDGSPTQKLLQANTHETPDTDTGPTAIHHTLGTGADQASRGTHTTPTFAASGGSHAPGHVPDPGASAGSTKFLREDASWSVPPGTGTPLVVEEEDGTPTGSPDTLKFPNGTLTDNGDGSFSYVPAPKSVGCRVSNSATQSIPTSSAPPLGFDTDDDDDYALHYTSAANLTGTVAKTASSTALVGTGTSFTTELSVGQVISVPGTAVEKRVVTAITDNTHLTVNTAFANSASGQTATRVNTAIVARWAGDWLFGGTIYYQVGTVDTIRGVKFTKNNAGTNIGGHQFETVSSAAQEVLVSSMVRARLAQWDFVEMQPFHGSAGAIDSQVAAGGAPIFWAQYLGT